MTKEEKLKEVLEYRISRRISRAQNEPIDDMDWFIENAIKDALEAVSNSLPSNLDETADNHIRKVVDTAGHPGWDWTTQDITDAFIAGAKWQKEKMMKDAVEGLVYFNVGDRLRVRSDEFKNPDIHFCDKVRIIVLPKED